jgi:hypothetical protein
MKGVNMYHSHCIKLLRIFLVVLLAVITLGEVSSPYSIREPLSNARILSDGESKTPISTSISINQLPLLGEMAEITCEITSTIDAPLTTATITLPSDAELLGGSLDWQGDLEAGAAVPLKATIKFNELGDQSIFCQAYHTVSEDESWGDLSGLYMSIGRNQSEFGFAKPGDGKTDTLGQIVTSGNGIVINQSPSFHNPLDLVNDITPESLPPSIEPGFVAPDTTSQEVTTLGTLTVTGIWRFIDRGGSQTNEQMIVEIVRGDNNAHLAWCYTGLLGYYSCGPFTNPGSAGVRSRFLTYTSFNPYADVLVVVNPNVGTSGNTANAYAKTTDVRVFSDGTADFGTWVVNSSDTYLPAYWVQKDLIRGWKYLWDNAGSSQSPQVSAGKVTVEWKIDSTEGDYYIHGGNVHLRGTAPNQNSVVNHEYGHAIMFKVYNNFPDHNCPDPHYMYGISNRVCAWTEGWANFYTLAVNNDPIYRWDNGASRNLETATWGSLGWDNGDQVEGRVAGALWDLLDSTNDGDDTYSTTFATIWQLFFDQDDNNFKEYWTAWLESGNTYSSPVMSIYQNTIDYRNGVPTIGNLDPSSATAGGTSFTLRVNGTNFVPNSVVKWNGSNRTTTYVSSTQLSAAISASDIATQGTANVTVFNPSPGGGTSNQLTFTINPVNNPVPSLSNLSPSSKNAGELAFTLTVNGSGFIPNSVVKWNGSNRTTTYVSSTQLNASISASDIATQGTANVTVFNSSPGGGTSNQLTFTVSPIISDPNDDFSQAIVIAGSSYSQNTTTATTATDDPVFTCASGQKYKTVWYRFTPPQNGVLTVSTSGSNYDTVLAVWTGTRGSLVNPPGGCNDDVIPGTTTTSLISDLNVSGGITYYIEVADYFDTGGTLVLTSTFTANSISTVATYTGGTPDGWVLETSENSNQGGVFQAAAATFVLGDDAGNRQYRSILHFNTSSLPDKAVITRIVLKIKRQGVTGTDPFTTHLKLAVDIRTGAFSNLGALQATDFQAAASKPGVGVIVNNPRPGGWYVSPLKSIAYPYINRAGITQFRLRFQTDDDNDAVADFLRFYSGNSTAANRPVLVIEYYVP